MVKMEIMFDTMAQPVLLFSLLQSVRLPRRWAVQAVGGGGGVRGGEGGLGPLLPAPGARLHRPGPGRVCGRQVTDIKSFSYSYIIFIFRYSRQDTKPLWTLAAHTQAVTGLALSSQCPGCLVTTSQVTSLVTRSQ